ncbi:MAG: SDR family NAD(P)-dependent oxidoreductase, partial [Paracoccaceae bacterium]|nr:SDR family NAD(P)-dependent oxidoreductase [Paracoccaceae bacterium]
MQIKDSVALVTGAASGLGEATARRLAAQGARVVVLDRDAAAAARVADEIGGLGQGADVTDPAAIEAALAAAEDRFGTPRIVVNCAGIGTAGRILPRDGDLNLAAFARTINV